VGKMPMPRRALRFQARSRVLSWRPHGRRWGPFPARGRLTACFRHGLSATEVQPHPKHGALTGRLSPNGRPTSTQGPGAAEYFGQDYAFSEFRAGNRFPEDVAQPARDVTSYRVRLVRRPFGRAWAEGLWR